MCNMRSDWFVEDEPSMKESDPHFDNSAIDGLMSKIRDFVKESDVVVYTPRAVFDEHGNPIKQLAQRTLHPVDRQLTARPVANEGDVYLDITRGAHRGYKPH